MNPPRFGTTTSRYEPSNFEHEFYGTVTLRRALAKSMNVATVKVAEMVGLRRRRETRPQSRHQRRREGHPRRRARRL